MKLNLDQITRSIIFFKDNINKLSLTELGIQNLLNLNKFLKACQKQHDELKEVYFQIVDNNLEILIKSNPEKQNALNTLFKSGLLINNEKANEYINKELIELKDSIATITNAINDSSNVLSQKEYQIEFDVEKNKLINSIEKSTIETDQVLLIADFLLV